MRITKEMLQKSARDCVTMRIKTEKDLVAAYLIGSALSDDFLFGGQADIDLVLVHSNQPSVQREIVRVYDEVHLDIIHHSQSTYLTPRELRIDPWLGYAIQDHPQLLYDVRHWFEFTQASAGSQFYRPDHMAGRSRKFSERARSIWTEMHQTKKMHGERIATYLKALASAGNAIACLSGPPISKRRFSQQIPARFAQIGLSDMYTGFLMLSGINEVSTEDVQTMLPGWEKAYLLASKQDPLNIDLHPLRKEYYLKAISVGVENDGPTSIGMMLLNTWAKAVNTTPATTPEYEEWLKAMDVFHLGKDDFSDRLNGLDHFLDRLEEAIDRWSLENGA
jgi:hypothetical protein